MTDEAKNHRNHHDSIRLSRPQLLLSLSILAVLAFGFIAIYKRLAAPSPPAAENNVQIISVERMYPVMGTMATVKLYGPEETADKAADKVQETLQEVQDICNIFDPKSELARLNATAADKPFRCSLMLWDLLLAARRAHQISDGSFDITIKPLMDVWGFYRKRETEPTAAELAAARQLVGLKKVIFNDAGHTVKFTVKGMAFDLGGIAKGFAVDLAAEAARNLGITSGLINLGGNIYCFPSPPPGKRTYSIAVRDPVKKDETCGTVEVKDQALSTSGNYERYVLIGNRRRTHIIDPRNGHPVMDMLAVTIITPKAVDADYLSTSVFINGPEFAEKIRELYARTSLLIIRNNTESSMPEIIKIGAAWSNIKLQP